MDPFTQVLFLRDLSKLHKDPQSGEVLLTKGLSFEKITVFGIVVDFEETSEENFIIQIEDSSAIANVLVSNHLLSVQHCTLAKGLFVVVFGFVKLLDGLPCQTVVALEFNVIKEPIEELLVELQAIQHYRRYYYPQLFPSVEERRGSVDNTVLALEEILHAIRKNHGLTFCALEKAFNNYSKGQLIYFLSKLIDNFSIYKHEDIYFPL
ncbi:hypothetical protein GpartN1_g2942.t1 [Galdieria partita]|uniref:CST complex subunit Stn1 N-terminal domain-containing protein n=1 Tax=Galdieria partita TaxID=83374 RepID=A0A9C7PVG7_9RHOD|nr:hypothetical protein GpartN1_g2942.t1 [Galdieria partita]